MADNRKLYKEAVQTFGHGPQTDLTVKMCADLITEIQKHKLMRLANVQKKIADVEIMCAQMRLVFPGVPIAKKDRLTRLAILIKQRNEPVDNDPDS